MVAAVKKKTHQLHHVLKTESTRCTPRWRSHHSSLQSLERKFFSFLEQDTENYNFLEGGVYATWSAQIDSPNRKRILTVNDSDPEHTKLMRKLAAANNGYEQDDFDEDIRTLTLKRNAQLSKFIQLICGVCHYTEHDDIL